MTLNPVRISQNRQFDALIREIRKMAVNYRNDLVEGGMSEAEASAFAQRLSLRLLRAAFDDCRDVRSR